MTDSNGVKRLANEHPDWIPIVQTCLDFAKEGGRFPGSRVLEKLHVWRPGLRMLVRYGILRHEKTTRGGKRAYYTMPNPEGVEKTLAEIGYTKLKTER
jgi:hypothetical protein